MFDDDFEKMAEEVAYTTRTRTFRVSVVGTYGVEVIRLQATSYATEGDVAKFYRIDNVDGDLVLVNHRSLRPFVDIEDISYEVAPQPDSVN
jgi:hypothetical protein